MNRKEIGGNWKSLGVIGRVSGLIAIGLLAGGPVQAAGTTGKKLNVKATHQEQSEWCWAACAEMVIEYLEPGTDVKQCDLAKREYQTTVDCCNESASNFALKCNPEGNLPELCFQDHDILYSPIYDEERLSWKDIKDQIDEEKPVLFSWYWNDSYNSGHMVVIYGYGVRSGKKVLYRRDPNPYPQVGTQTYIQFEADYKKLEHNETWYEIKKDGGE